MSEKAKPSTPAGAPAPDAKETTPQALVVPQGTTKEACAKLMLDAAKDLGNGELPQGQRAGRLAVVRFICNALGVTDPARRKAVWALFRTTPAWFGSNASAAAQAMGWRTTERSVDEEDDTNV